LTSPTVQPSSRLEIRNYQNEDYPALGHLYASITTRENTTFWWIGDEDNWAKETFSIEYPTILCVGNDSSEMANNEFFTKQNDFLHLNSLFRMKRNLSEVIPELTLDSELYFSQWKMDTPVEEKAYLDLEAEIWPDTPMGYERLAEYKQNPLWTAMIVREAEVVVGGLMV
jgi:hypothetical protein